MIKRNQHKIIRGGAWYSDSEGCRSASRFNHDPMYRNHGIGFRVSRPNVLRTHSLGEKPVNDLFDVLDDGSEGPRLVWLPGGAFMMGQDDSNFDDEKPAREVRVEGFFIGQYPVTFEEYDRFCMETGREKPNDAGFRRDRRPVINVTWYDARAYCNWLSGMTGENYRLPTEAEWEYACRAGTRTIWSCGDNKAQFGAHAWYWDNSNSRIHPVGTKSPNPWGLYDMHGNVLEWCADSYSEGENER